MCSRKTVLSSIIICFVLLIVVRGNKKCTKSDPRNIYDSCVLDYRYMTLWCDLTNFTCIPDPEDIKSQAPCQRTVQLLLNDSCLKDIDADILSKYISLEHIDFSDNQLTSLRNRTFRNTWHLLKLDITINYIREIDVEAFSVVGNLRELNLSRNQISNLPNGVFGKMTNLESLDLDDNNIEDFSTDWFPVDEGLQHLSLRNNSISKWIEPRPGQLMRMIILRLDGNKLESLSKQSFKGMKNLKELYLSRNIIENIEEETFVTNTELTTIDLRENRIKFLSKNLFKDKCSLRVLLLNGNELLTAQPDWFTNVIRNNVRLSSHMMTQMSGNPWTCDCRMMSYWMLLKDLEESGDRLLEGFSDNLDVECTSEEYRGGYLRNLLRDQLLSNGSCDEIYNLEPSKNTTSSTPVWREERNASIPQRLLLSLTPQCRRYVFSVPTHAASVTSEYKGGPMETTISTFFEKAPSNPPDNMTIVIVVVCITGIMAMLMVAIIYVAVRNKRGKYANKKQAMVDSENGSCNNREDVEEKLI